MDSPGSDKGPNQGPGPPGASRDPLERYWAGGKFNIVDLPLLMMTVGIIAAALVILIVFIICIVSHRCRQARRAGDVEEETKSLGSKRGSTASTMSSVLFALQAKRMFSLYEKDCKPEDGEAKEGQENTNEKGADENVEEEEVVKSSRIPGVASAGLIALSALDERREMDDDSLNAPEERDNVGSGIPQYGRLWFSVVYSEITQKLFIRVIKAKYLKARDKNNPLGTQCVKVFLLPDEFNLQESKLQDNTSDPHFDQTFEFTNIRADVLGLKTVRISVYDFDKRRVRHAHGHVIFPLAGYDVVSGVVIWRDLEPDERLPSAVTCGELKVSLTHENLTQALTISLWEGRNMQNSEYFGRNHSIQILLKLGSRIIESMSTTSRPFSSVIHYDDDSFVFSIPLDQLKSCSLVLLLYLDSTDNLEQQEEDGFIDKLNQEEGMELGKLVLGLETYSHGSGAAHWQEVISNPRQTSTRWHSLLSSIQVSTL